MLGQHKFIAIKGVNNKITDALLVAEEVSKLVRKLERINIPSSIKIKETWYPKRKELEKIVKDKILPEITIELSKDPLTKRHIGYQQYKDEPVN